MKPKSPQDTLAHAGRSALDTFERRPFEFSMHDSLNMSRQRKNMTRTRTNIHSTSTSSSRDHLDFLDLVSLICDIYQTSLLELIPMQQFHPAWENEEDMGNSCIVTSRSISSSTPSGTIRGETRTEGSKVIVKRTKKGIWQLQQYAAIHDLVTELRVRSHAPLRNNPYIVNLKGIAWDFENDDEEKPKPLLVEEFAPHRSLETFWERNNLRRMPFRIKASLCKDIAQGIKALHSCGIVHGDVKPGNILVFPFRSIRRPFMAKLTDFGHSVCEFEALECLPAWTPHWCAPEANQEASGMAPMTFRDMMATDVYSYGLVATSIMIGTSIFSKDFLGSGDTGSPADINAPNYLINRVMELVIHEDRVQLDSDFDLLVIHTLLNSTLQIVPSQRKSISDCIDIFSRYEETIYNSNQQSQSLSEYVPPYEVIRPVIARQPPIIGYRSLAKCSFLVKRKIVEQLEKSAMETSSQRRAACAWELCICYFSGFGVEKDWARARHWLTEAAVEGVRIAQAFYVRLNSAMAFSPIESLTMSPKVSSNGQNQIMDANALLSEWLEYAVSVGCLDVLPDLQELDKNIGASFHIEATETFRKDMAATIRLSKELSDGSKSKSHEPNLDSPLQVLRASVQGDLDFVQTALQSNPGSRDCFDSDGNTPLLLAAKYGNFSTVSFLLHHASTNTKKSKLLFEPQLEKVPI
ncbi:kinase-like protein [Xylaria arbuscula]|nr:kinase-like protein [Xylaria arbuscula]